MVCFGTRERDTAKGKEKLVGRGWRVRGGPARKMAGKMEGSLSIMPGPSASLYASNNSLIDLRKTGHLRAEKTAPSAPLPPSSALRTVHTNRLLFFSFLASPRELRGKENPRAPWTRPDCGFRLRCVENWQEGRGGWIETGASSSSSDKRARIEKRALQRKSAFPLSADALFWRTSSALPSSSSS